MILCPGAISCIGRCLAASLACPHQKPIAGDGQHTQNIQINKAIGKNGKCAFHLLEKIIVKIQIIDGSLAFEYLKSELAHRFIAGGRQLCK